MGEKPFIEKVGGVAGKWTAYSALGTFLLYLFGYLTLRFQLSTYGVATNLDIFDEKYLFAGCRFLVFLVSAVPNILIIILVLAAIGYVPYKLMPVSINNHLKRWVSAWCQTPIRLPLLGVVLSVALIQFVLRKCFAFGNVLFMKELPHRWLTFVLLANDGIQSLYFSGLVAGTLITAAILIYVLHRRLATTPGSQLLLGTLVFLVAVEFLLLPINYGILISTQKLPRVAEVSGDDKAGAGQSDWLVWESKDALTYLVHDSNDARMLVTIPGKDRKVRIVAYDRIFRMLFGASHTVPQTGKPRIKLSPASSFCRSLSMMSADSLRQTKPLLPLASSGGRPLSSTSC